MIKLSDVETQEIVENIFGESQIGQIPRVYVLKAINLTQQKLLQKQVNLQKEKNYEY